MRRKKFSAFFRTLLLFALAFLPCIGVLYGERGGKLLRAAAEGGELILPSSKEEYLPLEKPSSSAFSDGAFAIADQNILYVFDRAAGEYSRYAHFGTTGEVCEISSLSFTFDNKLFFSDAETHLFRYDVQSDTAELMKNLPCASFAVAGDTLYFSAVASTGTTLYAVPHNDPSFERAVKVGEVSSSGVPCLFAEEGKLYCAVDSLVHIFTLEGSEYVHSQMLLSSAAPMNLAALCLFRGQTYFADEKGLYRSGEGEKETILAGESIRALTVYQDTLYVTTASGVREATLSADGSLTFTGYEIAGASHSFNRLAGERDVARGGNLLVCADYENGRALVYDREKSEYFSLPCGAAEVVATDGEIVAAGVQNTISLYHAGETEPYQTYTARGKVMGIAVILGRCYFATESTFGEIGAAEMDSGVSCAAMTGDLLGNIYVVDAQGTVTRYDENDFTYGTGHALDFTLPSSFRALKADFQGNIYCLVEKDLYVNGAFYATVPEAFQGDMPVSLALEEREDAVLFGFENYVLKVRGLGVPVLDNISAANLYERVFSVPASGEISVIEVPEGVPGVLTDLTKLLYSSESFECSEVKRTAGGTGILLGRTQNYVLCALFEDFSYPVYLLPADKVVEGKPAREEPTTPTQFTLSETQLLYYPCLAEGLETLALPRAFPLTVLDVLTFQNGFPFAYVETADGVRGYLPLSLLSSVEPSEKESVSFQIGYLKASGDGVVFRTDSGETVTVHERKQVKIFDGGDNRYMVTFEENGTVYSAQVTGNMIENGSTNVIRISIIIVLCVVAVGLCAVYVILVRPKKKR